MLHENKKISRNMGLAMLCVAFVFYFLPSFTVIDLTPDVIAYLLIVIGLSKLSDVSESIADARRKFSYLIYYGVGRLVTLFIVFGVVDNSERPNAFLVAAFIFAVAEFCFLIPAYISLFDGLLYLGTREEGSAVFTSDKGRHKRSYTDTVKRFTIIFIVAKNVLATLPECLSLLVNVDVQSYNYSRYDDINYYRFIAMVASLTLGIIWLVRIEKYFSNLLRDRAFIDRLADKYTSEVLPNSAIFSRKRVNRAVLFFALGAFLAMDFYIDGNDGFNVIPDFLCVACFIIGTLLSLEKKSKYRKQTVVLSSLYGGISILTWIFNYMFTYEYTAADVSRKLIANVLWWVLVGASVIEAAAFFLMIGSVFLVTRSLIVMHTGSVNSYSSFDPLAKQKAIHKAFETRLYVCLAFAALASLGGPFRVWMFSSESMIADMSWIIEVVLTLIFAALFVRTLLLFKEEAEEKYSLM